MKLRFRLRPAMILTLAALPALSAVVQAQGQTGNAGHTLPSAIPSAPSIVDQLQNTFVKVAATIKPSVVTIYAERTPDSPSTETDNSRTPQAPNSPAMPSLPDDSQASLGSGIVVDNQGHILTNYHVVKDAVVIRVMGNSDEDVPARPVAKLIGYDQESDLAVLQVPPSPAFVPVQFGDSDALRVGEWVLAVGAPFDQVQTVTAGVISAKARHLAKDGQLSLQGYLQTDASINPGNSGGPLVNMQGKVIGVNTAILSPSRYSVGIGFAVPSATIKRLLPTLLQGKHEKRGFLGIRYLPLPPNVAEAFDVSGGMQIGALAQKDEKPYGPAFEAGLRKGDIITAVNGQSVTTSALFRGFVATLMPGTVIQLEVIRPLQQGIQHRAFEITLGDRRDDTEPQAVAPKLSSLNLPQFGLQVENTRELTASQRTLLAQPPNGLDKDVNRVIIMHVRPGTSADDAGLRQGELVEKINIMRRSVTGEESLGAWEAITDKNQFIKAVQDLLAQTKVLVQLQDKQEIVLYKMLTTATSRTQ